MKSILGLFGSYAAAERAVRLLQDRDFDAEDISIIAQKRILVAQTDRLAQSDARKSRAGTIRSAGLGGLTGLLVGLGATAVPGLGAVVVRGPLATAVMTATDGLARALMRLGLPKAVAQAYRDGLRQGEIVLAIHHVDRYSEGATRELLQEADASRLVHVNLDTDALEKMQQWYLSAQRTGSSQAATN